MAQQNNESIKVGRDVNKVWRERIEEIEESIVRDAQQRVMAGWADAAQPLLDLATRLGDALDVYDTIDENLFYTILSTEGGYSPTQIATEVTLVRCRLADVPEAWDMGGQASTKLPLQAAA